MRIDRASPVGDSDLDAWQSEITQLCQTEIGIHFAAEEQALFPVANPFPDLRPLVEELLADHAALRAMFAQAEARSLSATDLSAVAQRLALHIRKEERQLFEHLQQVLSQDELALLGKHLDEALKDAAQTCILPTDATRLRAAK